MVKTRTPAQIPAHHTQHYFAPGMVEHHRRRHMRQAARWFGRVLVLFFMAALVAAGANLLGGK